MEWRGISNQYNGEIRRLVLSVAMKQYWKDGETKSLEEILKEYQDGSPQKRDQMWFLYIDLRKHFDEIERSPEDLDCENDIFHLGSPHGKRRWGK
jgi:hypothetical protein